MSKTLIQCRHCKGTGRSALSSHLEETLSIIPRSGTIVAEEVAKKLGISTTNAASNRLAQLFRLGLVSRRSEGKYIAYFRK